MKLPSNSLLLCAALAIVIGLVEPSIEVAWKCRGGHETSEACTWGRSYLPLSRALGLLVVAPLALAFCSSFGTYGARAEENRDRLSNVRCSRRPPAGLTNERHA